MLNPTHFSTHQMINIYILHNHKVAVKGPVGHIRARTTPTSKKLSTLIRKTIKFFHPLHVKTLF